MAVTREISAEPAINPGVLSPGVLNKCLGELLDPSATLVLTHEPLEHTRELFLKAYPTVVGEPEIQRLSSLPASGCLERQRWATVCLVFPNHPELCDKTSVIRLLARLRDLHADRVVHIEVPPVNGNCESWTLADSLALGFSLGESASDESIPLQVFEFKMHTYKPAPDWLNAKHWANPELWGKYHW